MQELRLENGKDEAGLENRGFQVRVRSFVKSLRNVSKLSSRLGQLIYLN